MNDHTSKMKTAVIYASKHGAAKQYAFWIVEELRAELLKAGSVSP
jgi:flavodoxin